MRALVIVPRNAAAGDAADFNCVFSTSLGFIVSALERDGHEVDGLNLSNRVGSVESLVDKAARGRGYDMILTGGLSSHYHAVRRIVRTARASSPESKVVLGGGLVSSEPELIFDALKPDVAVVGEGDEAVRELAAKPDDCGNISGLCYRNGALTLTAARKPIMDLDALPLPALGKIGFGEYLDGTGPLSQSFMDVLDRPRFYPLITSRSCPYSCSFCFHPIGKVYRQRSLDSVEAELEDAIGRWGVNLIATYDELFSHDRERLADYCRRMERLRARAKGDLVWNCQVRVDHLDEDMVVMMRDAGCFLVSLGFESYSSEVLKSMRKHITPEMIDRTVRLLTKHRVSVMGNFIFGDAAETLATARTTLAYWRGSVGRSNINLGYIAPYPGTALYRHCLREGIIKDRLAFIERGLFQILRMSRMTEAEWQTLQAEVTVAELTHTDCAVARRVERDGRNWRFEVACPHCKGSVAYGNLELPFRRLFKCRLYCRACRRRFVAMSPAYRLAFGAVALALRRAPQAVSRKVVSALGKAWAWTAAQIFTGKWNVTTLKKLLQP